MRKLIPSLALASLVLMASAGQAQITLPVFDPAKDPGQGKPPEKIAFEEATQTVDFRPGTLVRVTLNDPPATKILGTLVRIDKKTTRIFVRTEPGSAPRAFSQKEIKKVEKAVRDGVRPAALKENVLVPEIHQMIVYNGGVKTVHYYSEVLSSAEKSRLTALEDAENDFARLNQLHGQKNSIVETEVAIQAERLLSHDLINRLLWQQVQSGFWVEFPSRSFHVLHLRHDQPELTKMLALMPTTEAWSKARETLSAQRAQAVFDDGRLVAVVVEEK